MLEVNEQLLQQKDFFLYIYTPFCGTCHIAQAMLEKIEQLHKKEIFLMMNASFYPEFMQEEKVESVPCLLIKHQGETKKKIYAFKSVANIYEQIMNYQPDLLLNDN